MWYWQQHMLNVHPRRWGYDIPLIPLAACTVGQLGKLLMRMIQGWPTVMGKKRYHKTSFLHLFCLCKHLLGDSSIYLHTQTTPLLSSSSFSLGIFRFPDHGCQESSLYGSCHLQGVLSHHYSVTCNPLIEDAKSLAHSQIRKVISYLCIPR